MRDGLAVVVEPGASIGATATANLASAFADVPTTIGSWGPLAAVATSAQRPGVAEGAVCLVAGRIDDAGTLAGRTGVVQGATVEATLAAAYLRMGPACLEHVRGSFVVLLWDVEDRRGLLAQDQLGNRSLYVAYRGRRLFAASDVAPLLRLLPQAPAPDAEAVAHLLANSDPPMPRTLYEGVVRLGHGRLLHVDDGGWEAESYWQPRFRRPTKLPRAELAEEVWRRIGEAVSRRVDPGERIGIVMSGGIDSSAVAAAAAEVVGGKTALCGYSAVFPGSTRYDESERVNALTGALSLPSVQIEPLLGGSLALSLEYLERWRLPLSGAGYVLEHPLVSRAAADGATALLDGQGGDEVFGLAPYLPADYVRRGRLVASMRVARSFPNLGHEPTWRHTFHLWRRFGLNAALPYVLHEQLRRRRARAPRYLLAHTARLYVESDERLDWKRGDGPLWWLYKKDVLTTAREQVRLPEYLRHRAAMAGLQVRLPLMELGLIELALSTHPELDFDQRLDRPIVREAMRGRVPEEIRLSPFKSNLGPFYHRGSAGPDLQYIRRLLLAPDAEIGAYVDSAFVQHLLARPPAVGERGWGMWLAPVWALLTTETWLRLQADAEFAQRLLAGDLPRPASRIHRAPTHPFSDPSFLRLAEPERAL